MPVSHSRDSAGNAVRARNIDIAVALLLTAGIAGLFAFDISSPRGQVDGVG
jgi:hypothetical protein